MILNSWELIAYIHGRFHFQLYRAWQIDASPPVFNTIYKFDYIQKIW